MQIGPYGRVIIKKSESILKSSACVIPKVFLFFVLFFVLASPLISLPAAAFDIYIPGKKNFKLTDKSAQNSVTETKTWLNDDHHVVLHFTDLFGLPEAGVPESAMNEETAVLASNSALITSTSLLAVYKGENWSERKELEPDADFGTIYYKRFDAKKPLTSKCVAFVGFDQQNSDMVYGIYCKPKELTDSEVKLALRSITLDETEASKPEEK